MQVTFENPLVSLPERYNNNNTKAIFEVAATAMATATAGSLRHHALMNRKSLATPLATALAGAKSANLDTA